MTSSVRFSPHPDVVASRVGDEIVLVHLATDQILSLNRTAARIWELLCSGCDEEDLERRLSAEFDVTPGDLERDVREVLATFRAHDLVHRAGNA